MQYTFLFEILKSSPGLLGTWASRTFSSGGVFTILVTHFANFCKSTSVSSWYNQLLNDNLPIRIGLLESMICNDPLTPNQLRSAIDLGIAVDLDPVESKGRVIVDSCESHCKGEPATWANDVKSMFAEDEWSTQDAAHFPIELQDSKLSESEGAFV